MASVESPTAAVQVRTVLAGIRRAKGTAPRTKTPTLIEDIRHMVAALIPSQEPSSCAR
jgi:hypothetical protein